jgi:hypothetical protein
MMSRVAGGCQRKSPGDSGASRGADCGTVWGDA